MEHGEDSPSGCEARPRAANGIEILLAEDDQALRELLAAAFREDGHTVTPIEDGRALATVLAATSLYGSDTEREVVVVSDVRLPGKDGLSVLREFRGRSWCPPFIMITGFGDREVHRDAAKLGAAALFEKPFDPCELRAAVLNVAGVAPQPR